MSKQTGKLYYVIGASGAGKDSIINGCRQNLTEHSQCLFAHRFITRPADAGGENHVALTPLEFKQRLRLNYFAMSWQANGYHYGIGHEINHWLENGSDVVVNGSRGYLGEAINRYSNTLKPVFIKVSLEVLRQRLAERGRETSQEIDQRLLRAKEFNNLMSDNSITIRNDGALEEAISSFHSIISRSGKEGKQPQQQVVKEDA